MSIIMKKYLEVATSLKPFMTKTQVLACILRLLILDHGIKDNEYMIMASYCMKDFRAVTDLDVVVLKPAYQKIKNKGVGSISQAKMSGNERILLSFENILGEGAEIELFPKNKNQGFPTSKQSLGYLHKHNQLIKDEFGNPYYSPKACAEQYSDIIYDLKTEKYMFGPYEISKERVKKNINHLTLMLKNFKSDREFISTKLNYLKQIYKGSQQTKKTKKRKSIT